ncbi:MAG: sodium/proton-translocating pyrophosphatase, partial [Candidatus Aenigmarchaeota archaeon]|nr:sodium/proton-translocating pyrophosphatase [Candidatus Aenigmarchaeota archaeon]
MGMLSIAGMVLGLDGFGPIVDNAGGIVEMSGGSSKLRKITDSLDSAGNTTKALTKGYAMASAGLAALLLFQAYLEVTKITVVDIVVPKIIVGLFIGCLLPFIFASFAIRAVGKAAFKMVEEVRRQFKEIPGIMTGKAKPDYSKCIEISTVAAQKEMILPGLIPIAVPILIGFTLGAEAVGALLIGATLTGFILAMMMNTGGAAWDNAKKYIEDGFLGGKGSEAHKAAVTGDTVGDPFKDTAGPSLHVLVKLLNTICLTFGMLFVLHALL